jgi:hypothetical protein
MYGTDVIDMSVGTMSRPLRLDHRNQYLRVQGRVFGHHRWKL